MTGPKLAASARRSKARATGRLPHLLDRARRTLDRFEGEDATTRLSRTPADAAPAVAALPAAPDEAGIEAFLAVRDELVADGRVG